jgi:hypothetical protein
VQGGGQQGGGGGDPCENTSEDMPRANKNKTLFKMLLFIMLEKSISKLADLY